MNILLFISMLLLSFIILFITIIIHELGHLVFGYVTGYKFVSFRILSLLISKSEDCKFKISFSKSTLLGQCLMLPPAYKNFKYILYNLGGGIFNISTALIFYTVSLFIKNSDALSFLFVVVFINIVIAVINLIPIKQIMLNDGLNVLTASKSNMAKYGLYLSLYYNHKLSEGDVSVIENYDLVDVSFDYNVSNYFESVILMFKHSYYMERKQYQDAVECYKMIEIDKLPLMYSGLILNDLLYYYLIIDFNENKAKAIYNDKVFRKLLNYKNIMPPIALNDLAYKYFINKEEIKIESELTKIQKLIENEGNKGTKILYQKNFILTKNEIELNIKNNKAGI